MTYSSGNAGYQPAQPQGPYGSVNPSFAKSSDDSSKLPLYLQVAVAVLGLATYLASFGPMLTAGSGGAGPIGRGGLMVPLAVLAALLAAAGLLPKAKNYTPVVAVLAVLGALVAIKMTLTKGDIGWALWLVLSFTVVQAIVAVVVLLLDAGVLTAPAPRPKYDPYAQYGLPMGGGYFGQPGQPGQPGPGPGHQPGPHQGGYPSYGGYPPPSPGGFGAPPATPAPSGPPAPSAPPGPPPGPSGPSTGGFGTGPQRASQHGPSTPPTGFPSFSPPPGAGSGPGSGQGAPPPGAESSQPPSPAKPESTDL